MKMILLLISLFAFNLSQAQDTLIVYFKDKGNTDVIQLSERAIKRRKKNNVTIDSRDQLVNQAYIDFMKTEGEVLNVSRWLNGVTLITTATEAELIQKYSFIKSTRISKSITPVKGLKKLEFDEAKAANYGPADIQIEQINLDCLHDQGFNGNGVFIAVIDAGFNGMDTIAYFDSAYVEGRVIETHDFLSGTSNVYQYSGHGTAVSSCIIAEQASLDPISATAVEVDIALYVSENAASETIIEEFDLVLALERADSVGADIATISLGYTNFDNPADDHPYSDMDGETTIAAIGVNAAASKGILVVTSAGNSGPAPISTPCDADSALCIGAIDGNGFYVDFSSVGPSADGQVKPDVVARGADAAVVTTNGTITQANGTSFSAPIMAGAMACLIQAKPTATVMELQWAIRQSGISFNNPNIFTGYGTPDLCEALDTLNSTAGLTEINSESLSIFPNPSSGFITIDGFSDSQLNIEFQLVNLLGEIMSDLKVQQVQSSYVLDLHTYSSGVYFVQVLENDQVIYAERVVKR